MLNKEKIELLLGKIEGLYVTAETLTNKFEKNKEKIILANDKLEKMINYVGNFDNIDEIIEKVEGDLCIINGEGYKCFINGKWESIEPKLKNDK